MARRLVRTGTAVTVAAAALLGAGHAAQAAPAAQSGTAIAKQVFASADPHAAYNKLTAAQRASFNSVELPAVVKADVSAKGLGSNDGRTLSSAQLGGSVESAMKVIPYYSGCWAMAFSGGAKAAAGNTLYTYGQSTEVCVSNNSVTAVYVYNVWDETSTPGWRIDKDPTTKTFNAGWEGRGLAQYYFVLGVAGWDVQHPTTCLQGRLNGNGYNYLVNYSCNLS